MSSRPKSSRAQPATNRSPAILVTDARSTRAVSSPLATTPRQPNVQGNAQEQQQQHHERPRSQGSRYDPRRLLPSAGQQGTQHQYSNISVSQLLFEHGESDIPSSHTRRAPPPNFNGAEGSSFPFRSNGANFAPYSTFERRRAQQQPVRSRGTMEGGATYGRIPEYSRYEDVPMQSNVHSGGVTRDPRFVVSSALAGQPMYRRRLGHAAGGYRDNPDEAEEEDDDELEFDSDFEEEDDPHQEDKVIWLPMPDTVHSPDKSDNDDFPSPGRSAATTSSLDESYGGRRVTAYLTADSYNLVKISKFAARSHFVTGGRIYGSNSQDAALYLPYKLPLQHGRGGLRIRSGGSMVDILSLQRKNTDSDEENEDDSGEELPSEEDDDESPGDDSLLGDLTNKAELFVFRYGVMVFWNFTEEQEQDILADITFSDSERKIGMEEDPIPEKERETEKFTFIYSRSSKPQINNDVITLRADGGTSDTMHKLTMCHAIAQSTKLSYFETRIETIAMLELETVPQKLALEGHIGDITRQDILKVEGHLFRLRVDVNLSSSVLDVPQLFWDEEPGMHDFYVAIREYLEVKQRIKVLNHRCRVFLDLADILSDTIAKSNMAKITWIIILLIVASLVVSTIEIVIRFMVLSGRPIRPQTEETSP
ncbi:uncharacterized protein V1518DRAFT_420414 [Limtongia smithiae]|uniref:uncharacterized protein n=1 Tax=Limtongia smithiae TaxID=1125753 RepID=UPI0034CFE50F